ASDVVISDTLAEAVRAEGQGALIDTFVASAPLHVRGREREIAVLTWSGPESATAAQGPS
ncbi:MAG TPA: hypothetical protein VE631_02650, partial [Alphaproteobacteria bacterium]|nr:hypothetical protein [Alphaproteobacteria bacterium]